MLKTRISFPVHADSYSRQIFFTPSQGHIFSWNLSCWLHDCSETGILEDRRGRGGGEGELYLVDQIIRTSYFTFIPAHPGVLIHRWSCRIESLYLYFNDWWYAPIASNFYLVDLLEMLWRVLLANKDWCTSFLVLIRVLNKVVSCFNMLIKLQFYVIVSFVKRQQHRTL